MKKELHQSQINTFLKCGLQYEFRYIQNIKIPPRGAMTLGSSVDAGSTRNYIQKIDSGKDLSLGEVLDVYSTDFDLRSPETDWQDEDQGQMKDVGAKLLKAHHETIAPNTNPETVQEKFKIETDAGFDLGGTIDLTTKEGVVIDTKTSSRKYDTNSINTAIQPILYDYAYEALRGKKAKSFRYDVLIKPTARKPVEVQQIEAPVSQEARVFLFEGIQNISKAIDAGIALPAAEGSWWCSKEWCGYGAAGICKKFKGNKV